ncbi:MAG: hypothetical protein WCT04_01905 [Planctomycetota bacterium]
MKRITHSVRAGLLAILFAALGFSYALATSHGGTIATGSIAAPNIGSTIPVDFTNPFLKSLPTSGVRQLGNANQIRDLGDAVAGSVLSRLVRAKGGIAPYVFSTTIPAASQFQDASLQLFGNGIVSTIGSSSSTPPQGASLFTFPVTVVDSTTVGTNVNTKTETFALNFVRTEQFRFANDNIASGVQFQPYSAQMQTINGRQGVTYFATGLPAGLSMSSDGTVYGIPIIPGTFTFIANARDAANKQAADRSGVGTHQSVSITIENGRTFNGILAASNIVVSANSGAGKDGLSYKGVINLGAAALPSLNGKPFSIHIGSYSSPSVNFNATGMAASPKSGDPDIRASIKSSGMISVGIGHETINLGPITGKQYTLPVEIRVGDAVIGSECLTFDVHVSGTGVSLFYNGSVSGDYGGAGQLLRVQGSDDKGGMGDDWLITFLARIPQALAVNTSTTVDLSINSKPIDSINLLTSSGLLYGGTPVVRWFGINMATGRGTYQTITIPSGVTGIPAAGKSGNIPTNFTTGMTFRNGMTPTSSILSSLSIVPKGSMWTSQ